MEESRIQDTGVSGTDHSTAAWLAWSLCALSLVLTAFGLWLLNLNLDHPGTPVYEPWLDNTLSALSYAPIGALVASRRPANPAARTLEAYSARLREETDLGSLSEGLIGAVKETMQPEHISLWLRSGTAFGDRQARR